MEYETTGISESNGTRPTGAWRRVFVSPDLAKLGQVVSSRTLQLCSTPVLQVPHLTEILHFTISPN